MIGDPPLDIGLNLIISLHPLVSKPIVPMSAKLFTPLRISGLELANRVVVSPMCQYSANDGRANDWHMTHLGMLANSGAGLVVVEATHVERQGRITRGCLGLYSDACEDALARVVAHCKRIGTAKLGVQIAHAGRKASAQRPWEGGGSLKGDEAWQTIAPSAIPFGDGWATPRAATADDLARIPQTFVQAAERAVRIGFDAIELHMAHGYLLHEFMSPVANQRNDEYGGTLEGRMRFPLQVVRAVRAVVPKGMPLGARMTGSDWLDDGLNADDAVAVARLLKQAGLDYVDISSGGVAATAPNPTTLGYNVPIAERINREVGLVTRTVGLIMTPQQAEAIVAEGKADCVSLGRAMLDDPHWAWHAARDLGAEVERPAQYKRVGPTLWAGAKRA
jgi:2,4-dienoyl-CoA reductase-like NADH-dependent reductase (Old Yellow Enzyme family)